MFCPSHDIQVQTLSGTICERQTRRTSPYSSETDWKPPSWLLRRPRLGCSSGSDSQMLRQSRSHIGDFRGRKRTSAERASMEESHCLLCRSERCYLWSEFGFACPVDMPCSAPPSRREIGLKTFKQSYLALRASNSFLFESRMHSTHPGGRKWAQIPQILISAQTSVTSVSTRLTCFLPFPLTKSTGLHVKELAQNASPISALRSYLASLPTPTALPSAVQTLVRLLLQYTAVYTGSSHLVLGTSLTSLAISLISSVTQGGGFHVKEETQEEWFPDYLQGSDDQQKGGKSKRTSVRIIRPLRDVGIKECAVWAWWMRLPIVGRERIQWPGAKPGLGRLTKGEQFVSAHDFSLDYYSHRFYYGARERLSFHCLDYRAYMWEVGTEGSYCRKMHHLSAVSQAMHSTC